MEYDAIHFFIHKLNYVPVPFSNTFSAHQSVQLRIIVFGRGRSYQLNLLHDHLQRVKKLTITEITYFKANAVHQNSNAL